MPGRFPVRIGGAVAGIALTIAALSGCAVPPAVGQPPVDETRLALVTDFGTCDAGEEWAARTVRSWGVEAIITGGDNTQNQDGGPCTPYTRSVWGSYDRGDGRGDPPMWPTLGNHDYGDPGAGLSAYQAAFPYLPTDADPQHRWYGVRLGHVALFVVDSEAMSDTDRERQRVWLKGALRASRAADPRVWNLVVLHRPPYTSGLHEPNTSMRPAPEGRWNYAAWGADLVVSGHQHIYEDVVVDGFHYVTAGIAAGSIDRQCPDARTKGSRVCVTGTGVNRITASADALTLEYVQAAPDGGTRVADTVRLTR